MRPAASGHAVRIAAHEAHVVGCDAELIGDHLGEGGRVPLAGGLRPDGDLDHAFGQHRYVGMFVRRTGQRLG